MNGTRWTMVAALALTAVAACAPKVDQAAEEAAVREVATRYLELAKARDAAGIAAIFTADGAWYPATFTHGFGPAGVEAAWAESFAFNPSDDSEWAADRFDVAASGDLAVEHGSFAAFGGGAGHYLTVYRKEGGAWKVASDMSVPPAGNDGAPQWARDALARWYQAFNGRDLDGLVAYYAADAVVGGARGRTAIADMFRSDWAERPMTCQGGYDSFRVVGPVAVGWGRDTCTGEAGADGVVPVQRSNWVSVYEQQADGSWICTRDHGVPVEG